MALGIFVIIHSVYLHGLKPYTAVRLCAELCALALIGEAACFYSCLANTCTLDEGTILYNLLGNAVFGLICQCCDNYLTFARYAVVAGGATRLHHMLAFAYFFVLLTLSWWLFFTFLPFGYDMNSAYWTYMQLVFPTWLNFISYIIYDVFYVGAVIVKIVQISNSEIVTANTKHSLRLLGIRAIGHTLFSLVGIFVYSFYIPFGIIEQNIFITFGIHFCLNWGHGNWFFDVLCAKLVNGHPRGSISPGGNLTGGGPSLVAAPSLSFFSRLHGPFSRIFTSFSFIRSFNSVQPGKHSPEIGGNARSSRDSLTHEIAENADEMGLVLKGVAPDGDLDVYAASDQCDPVSQTAADEETGLTGKK